MFSFQSQSNLGTRLKSSEVNNYTQNKLKLFFSKEFIVAILLSNIPQVGICKLDFPEYET